MAQTTVDQADLPVARRPWYRRRLWPWLLVVIGLLVLYFLGGMIWLHEIDADPDFALESSAPEGGSQAVAVAADLIDREINTHRWVANDAFFMPGSLLDNMPEFQQGIIAPLSRFALELTDQIGRTRGSSQADPDLDRAAGLLRYPGTIWIFDFRTSWAPTASSEQQYRQAMAALRSYNQRLAQGQAVLDTRADNLIQFIDRIAGDIGSTSAILRERSENYNGGWFDTRADDRFWFAYGQLYGYYGILTAARADFADVIAQRGLTQLWAELEDQLRASLRIQPLIISNGSESGLLMPSHLATLGFYILRVRSNLVEIRLVLDR